MKTVSTLHAIQDVWLDSNLPAKPRAGVPVSSVVALHLQTADKNV